MSAKDMFFSKNTTFRVAEKRAYAREELVYNVTEDILVTLEDMGVSKKELAYRLGKSRSYVTQILSGARNMTLGTLSDICFALGIKPKITIESPSLIDAIGANTEGQWQVDSVNLKQHHLIVKSENVYDCRDREIWQNQAA